MKQALTILASIAVAVSALAAPGNSKSKTTIHCDVMPSNVVNIASATKSHSYADYKGKRYFFCCGGCPAAFKKDPSKYVKGESIPTPKPTKK